MPNLPLVGPSNALRNTNADSERTINWQPMLIESGNGKGGARGFLKQPAGLRQVADLGAEVRGLQVARGALYAVAGDKLKSVSSAWSASDLHTLSTSSGLVGSAINRTQICVVDGLNGYVHDLDALTTANISSAGWRGSNLVAVLDGRGIFAEPETNQWYASAAEDFTSLDPLDFASTEGSPGNIVSWLVRNREVLFLQDQTGESWVTSDSADSPLLRNTAVALYAGCVARNTFRELGGSVFWLGRDERGAGVVFRMDGYVPIRCSSHALEEQLATITDYSGAYAFAYHLEGLSNYVLTIPGLPTSWVFDLASGLWYERAEWVDGEYQTWRPTCHAYAYGQHIVGDADGKLYILDPEYNRHGSDVMVRDRITQDLAQATNQRIRFGSFQVDCTVGNGLSSGHPAHLMLRYSDDGARTWSNWRTLTLGEVGQYQARARASMLGASRSRVWHIRATDDVRVDVIAAIINEV